MTAIVGARRSCVGGVDRVHTAEQREQWRPAQVGAGLVVGAAMGAVFWGLSALFVAGGGYQACERRSGRAQGRTLEAWHHWLPLQAGCSVDGSTYTLTSGIVTLLWSIAALVLMAAAALGISLLAYGLIRWLVPRRR